MRSHLIEPLYGGRLDGIIERCLAARIHEQSGRPFAPQPIDVPLLEQMKRHR